MFAWLKKHRNKKSKKEVKTMTLEELKQGFAELSEEDKSAFLEAVSVADDKDVEQEVETDGEVEATEEEQPTVEAEVTAEPEEVQEEEQVEEPQGDLVGKITALEQQLAKLTQMVEKVAHQPQEATPQEASMLDKIRTQWTN